VHRNKPVRVLVVDDSPSSLEDLCAFLKTLDGIEVVGTARNGFELTKEAETLRPDLVITDLHAPRLSGLECTMRLRQMMPETRFIIFSDLDAPFTKEESAASVADFYFYKEHMTEKAAMAIRHLFPDLAQREPALPNTAKEEISC